MTIQETIQKAIEGGYLMLGFAEKPLFSWSVDKYWGGWLISVRYGEFGKESIDKTKHIDSKYNDFDIDKVLLDPLFWQSLGRSMGWNKIDGKTDIIYCHKEKEWQGYWHKMIDHLVEGGSVEGFFEKL